MDKEKLNRTQTELIDYFINPSFLDRINQSVQSIAVGSNFSFNMERGGKIYHVTMYSGKEGQVNISTPKYLKTILRDYCKNMEDFENMLKMLDNLAERSLV